MSSFTYFFFFSSRRRHTRCSRDWSSDVCSSDLFETSSFFANQKSLFFFLRLLSLPHLRKQFGGMLPGLCIQAGVLVSHSEVTGKSHREPLVRFAKLIGIKLVHQGQPTDRLIQQGERS